MLAQLNNNPELLQVFRTVRALGGAWAGLLTVTPLYYAGSIAGSEFITYSVDKLYIGQRVFFDAGSTAATAGANRVTLYSAADAVFCLLSNNSVAYNSVDLVYKINNIVAESVYFSRLATLGYNYMYFLGYRLIVA